MPQLQGNQSADVLQFLTDLRDEFDECTSTAVLDNVDNHGEPYEVEEIYLRDGHHIDVTSIRSALPELSGITAAHGLPPKLCDSLDRFCGAVVNGDDDLSEAQSILAGQITALSTFMAIRQRPADDLVTAAAVADFLGIKRTSLKTESWPAPAVQVGGNQPHQFSWGELKPALERQYPKEPWDTF